MQAHPEPGAADAGDGDLLVHRLVEPEVIDAAAAVLLGDGHAEEAALAGFGEHLARGDAVAFPAQVVRR